MPLVSRLFADDAGLQACLVKDSAHLTPGSRGKSVERVQAALVRMSFLEPGDALREAGVYGKATADAVLIYKEAFGVINRSYQSKADNIVGKMTIALLDTHINLLDSFAAKPLPDLRDTAQSHSLRGGGVGGSGSAAGRTRFGVGPTEVVAGPNGFVPPLSALPSDIQDTIRRSNAVKVPGTPSLYPFIGNHEGPLGDQELSDRIDKFPADKGLMMEIYNRMKPFGIWDHVNTIRGFMWGAGARGMFCHPHDHARVFAHMQKLSTGPTPSRPAVLNDISRALPVTDSRFCKDAFNVHGERDSWREIVSSGPGLHICVTNASGRARTDENYPASDFHIDEIQQGQFCSNGTCIPLVNGQTIGHLQTVGPWLRKQPGEWWKKHNPF